MNESTLQEEARSNRKAQTMLIAITITIALYLTVFAVFYFSVFKNSIGINRFWASALWPLTLLAVFSWRK